MANNDFLKQTQEDLFKGLNQDPFSSGGGSDNNSLQGSSIWDSGGDPLSVSDSGSMGQSQGNGQGSFNSGEPIFDVFMNVMIGVGTFLFSALVVLTALPNVIQKSSGDDVINKSKRSILALIPLFVVSVICFFIGYYSDNVSSFALGSIGIIGCLSGSAGFIFMFSTVKLSSYKSDTPESLEQMVEEDKQEKISEVTDEEMHAVESLSSSYTDSFDDLINSILEEEGIDDKPVETTSGTEFVWEDDVQEDKKIPEEVDTSAVLTLNSQSMWKMFSPLFPVHNKNFAKTTDWTADNQYSSKWKDLYAIIASIFADAYGIDASEVSGDKRIMLLNVKDAQLFTYCEVSKPPRKQVKPEIIQDLFDNYSSSLIDTICDKKQLYEKEANNKISSKVWLDGDRFKIVLTKPNNNAVLLGDVLLKEEVQEKLSSGKDTPIVLGIDDLGNPIIENFTNKTAPLYAGLIGGGAGSGKSWFFIATLAQMVAFNTPSDVQIVTVDPKPDTVFNELDLLPHVAKTIQIDLNDPDKLAIDTLDMLDKLTNVEVARRGALFKDEKCANIQDYRKKGHKELPYIFVFIDEYIKLRECIATYSKHKYEQELEEWQEACDNLEKGQTKPPKPKEEDQVKRLDTLMKVLTTTGRAPGIYVYIISHRFTGNVDIQTRNLTPLKLVLKSSKLLGETMDPDDIKKFTKKLINAGDVAIKVGEQDIISGKTLGVCFDDSDTYSILRTIAKTLYKIGFDLPDLSHLGKSYVKNIEAVKAELYKENKVEGLSHVQFDDAQTDKADEVIQEEDVSQEEPIKEKDDAEDFIIDFEVDETEDNIEKSTTEDEEKEDIIEDFNFEIEDNTEDKSLDLEDLDIM